MKGINTTLISIFCAIALAFAGAWVQINSRISVLEIEVQNDHSAFAKNSEKMDGLIESVNEIKENIVEMRGEMKMKADKKLVN